MADFKPTSVPTVAASPVATDGAEYKDPVAATAIEMATGPVDGEPKRKPRHEIKSLQVMRGLAALAVAFYHTNIILSQKDYGALDILHDSTGKGWMGVNFFFVLSGFIITTAHYRDIGRPESLKRYAIRRFTRVYPIYWILLTIFIVAATVGFGHADFKWSIGDLFTDYTLLQVTNLPTLPLKVAWTLLFEIKFYIVFAALIASRRIGLAIISIWAIGILIRNAFYPLPDWGYITPDWGMLSFWNFNFLVGMLSAWASRKLTLKWGALMLGIGVLTLAYLARDVVDMGKTIQNSALMLGLAPAFGLIILGGTLSEKRYSLKIPSWATIFGDASYSIYLVHSAAISLMAALNHKLNSGLVPPAAVFALTFAGAIVAGVAVHLLIEKPLLKAFHNRRG